METIECAFHQGEGRRIDGVQWVDVVLTLSQATALLRRKDFRSRKAEKEIKTAPFVFLFY